MSVWVATPYYKPHVGRYVESIIFSEKSGDFGYKTVFGEPIDVARNHLVSLFLETNFKYLLFIDNDCSFHPESIVRLMNHDVPMVCGTMWTVDTPPMPTMGKYVGMNKDGQSFYEYDTVLQDIVKKARDFDEGKIEFNEWIYPKEKSDLREIDGCGMHFCMIRRDVLTTISAPWFIFLGNTMAGEDFYFCKKVREAGYPIYYDISINTGHMAGEKKSFGLRDFLMYARRYELNEIVRRHTQIIVG